MRKNIFNWYHMLVMAALSAGITALIVGSQADQKGKYALLDKEAAVASAVFSKPAFNETDRQKIIALINAVQKRYTDKGYVVLTKESCKSDTGAIVLTAIPSGSTIDITQDLVDAFQKNNGGTQ